MLNDLQYSIMTQVSDPNNFSSLFLCLVTDTYKVVRFIYYFLSY